MAQRWTVDFNSEREKKGYDSIPEPLGYNRKPTEEDTAAPTKKQVSANAELRKKKIWELAYSPSKSYFMQAFMLWMSGSQIHIFSIIMTYMTLMNPLSAIFSSRSAFARFDDGKTDLLLPQLVYCALQFVIFLGGMYKCQMLGLLPTAPSDWLPLLSVKNPMEYSFGSVSS
eukprot:TRINITY_DN19314_c0_g1::TRINITY_DN19314_c0_g1_i1::g.15902::m.15902 TRINITY_DN19314_c0_g1::TRINITY_DN19314_c0_g1_i1::g.15902  ORF type:complete len:171 (-),score=30.87,sp/O94520/YQ13_SCHPO/38.36/8e-24,DUF1077/PF06417.7/2.7e-37 TRINITY_DN19314_c0_g1_i1:570-1082(-)